MNVSLDKEATNIALKWIEWKMYKSLTFANDLAASRCRASTQENKEKKDIQVNVFDVQLAFKKILHMPITTVLTSSEAVDNSTDNFNKSKLCHTHMINKLHDSHRQSIKRLRKQEDDEFSNDIEASRNKRRQVD